MNTHKHVCPLCDYVYDDSKGDRFLGITAGTQFTELPDSWKHPGCTGTKEMFETCTCVAAQNTVKQKASTAG